MCWVSFKVKFLGVRLVEFLQLVNDKVGSIFMPERNMSVGFWKLCHNYVWESSCISTRFQDSRSFNVLVEEDGSRWEDQWVLDAYSSTTFPLSTIQKTPLEYATGSSLLATHVTVCRFRLWYHIPWYLFSPLPTPGEKNPGSNEPFDETRFCGWVMCSLTFRVYSPKGKFLKPVNFCNYFYVKFLKWYILLFIFEYR